MLIQTCFTLDEIRDPNETLKPKDFKVELARRRSLACLPLIHGQGDRAAKMEKPCGCIYKENFVL